METSPPPEESIPSAIRVETETFEGPFDLLLHLVRVDEMDIFDIDISEITEKYLGHLARMEQLNLEIAGEFLVMAATLLNIKSRTLLPVNPHLEDEEEESLGAIQTTEDLVRQLIEYRRFKEIAQVLGEREVSQMRVFYRTHLPPPRRHPTDEEEPRVEPQAVDTLLGAFARVIEAVGIEKHHEIFDDAATVEDALARVREVIARDGRARLSTLLRACRTRGQMIVTVLALLEMTKLCEIRIEQAECFDDVHITARTDAPIPVPADADDQEPAADA